MKDFCLMPEDVPPLMRSELTPEQLGKLEEHIINKREQVGLAQKKFKKNRQQSPDLQVESVTELPKAEDITNVKT